MYSFRVLLMVLAGLLVAPFSVLAQTARYDACMNEARQQPTNGYETALAWQAEGGGAAARHCIASALLGMGDLHRAADRLENLGHAPDIYDDALRAKIFGQAAEVYLQLNRASDALASIEYALGFQPQNSNFQIDRARSLAALGKTNDAINQLDVVLQKRPDQVLALTLRATSLIELQQLAKAKIDVDRAMTLKPNDIDVLLLRGELREAIRLATPG
ncbi:MAG: hypothetical protein COA47_04460 [Robiginitomaculum sp.]|nr:MAG: hypothetical protein COA47_04460 [Robiginitomaculum sp.]